MFRFWGCVSSQGVCAARGAADFQLPSRDAFLSPLVGGNTPLYDSVDLLRQQWLGPVLPDGLGKAHRRASASR